MGVVNEDKRNLQKFEDEAGVSVEQHLADIQNIAAKQGVGAAATAHLQDLEDRKANIQQLAKQGKWGAIAQAGFAMAQAATVNPHGGFLGALAVGGAKGGELFQQNLQQYHKAMSDLQDQKYAVAQSQENLKLHFTDQAVAEKDKAQQRYDAAYGHYATSVGRLIGVIGGRELQGDISKAMIASRAQLNPANLFAERYINAPDEASKQRALDDYKSWNSASTQVQSAETRGQNAGEVARAKLMNNPAYIAAQTQALSKNPDTAARGQSEIQRLEAAQARLMGSAPQGPAQGAGGPNPSVIEQEMRRRGLLQ
jgi:uncharacterized membrane-anchored protein YhcB (DUF1043 family)